MEQVELKKKIINRINSMDNQILLEEICRIVGVSIEGEDIYYFTEEELKAVEEAEQQYERGEFISGEEADKIIREWLEK